jgi:hypothetical protein
MSKAANGSRYLPEFAEQARFLCGLGAIDKDLAKFFNVSVLTVQNWRKAHPAFATAVAEGREPADENVVRSLYQRATGYSHDDTDIRVVDKEIIETDIVKHYPPDTTACIFWLKNRLPELWRDISRREHTGAGGGPVKVEDVSDLEKARRIAYVLSGAAEEVNPDEPIH